MAVIFVIGCGCPEEDERGVYIPSGSAEERFVNTRGMMYSMVGSERISASDLKDISLFHLIVLEPGVQLRGSGGGIETRCLRATGIFWWDPGNLPRQEVDVSYDGKERTIRVGAQTYPTARSNCFILRLDEKWQPSVTPLPVLITDRLSEPEVLARIGAALPSDREIQALRTRTMK